MEPIDKPGWQTTEFWKNLIIQIVGILVITGFIGADQEGQVKNDIAEAIKNIGALIGMVAAYWKYAQTRRETKTAKVNAVTVENQVRLAAITASNPAKVVASILILVMICPSAWSADYNFIRDSAGKYYLVNSADPAQPNKPVTVSILDLGTTPIIPPGPVIPPVVPTGDLSAVLKSALTSVPAYTDKEKHRRSMAMGMSFLAQAATGVPVDRARADVKAFCNTACGADAVKWAGFWSVLDAKLDGMALTPASYSAALKEMAGALVADLPLSASEPVLGQDTYGLSPEVWQMLFKLLLQLLEQWLNKGAKQ